MASKPKLPIGGLALGRAFMVESNFLDRHLVKFQHPPHHLAFAGFIVARLLHITHCVRISFKMIEKLVLHNLAFVATEFVSKLKATFWTFIW